MKPPSLLQETLELLHASKLKPREICDGARVQYAWLMKLKAGEIPNPGVNGIQALHDFLTGAK